MLRSLIASFSIEGIKLSIEEARELLRKAKLLKAKLTSRALKAEEDLVAGRVRSTDQVRERLASRKNK